MISCHSGPVIVNEGFDFSFFRSAVAAEAWLEPWCVDEGIKAYDVQGCELLIVPNAPAGPVRIETRIQTTPSPDLEHRLRTYLRCRFQTEPTDESYSRMSLTELIRIALNRFAEA